MKVVRSASLIGAVILVVLGLANVPAQAQTTQPATGGANNSLDGLEEIVVTVRRTNELLQDVPVAVSVISPATIDVKGVFTPADLAESTPGLTVRTQASSRDDVAFTIRGQGFEYGTIFPAVVSYFDEVPIPHLLPGAFFDLSNVQILRGPQGVEFGRVTDGGNIMISPQAPKEELGGYLELKTGNYNLTGVDGAINIPIVDDKVLFRGAMEVVHRDGYTHDVLTGENLDSEAYESYRATLTIRPVASIENTTTVNYVHLYDNGTGISISGFNPNATGLIPGIAGFVPLFAGAYGLDANGNVQPFRAGLTPLTAASYEASIQSQLATQRALGPRQIALANPSYDDRIDLVAVNATTFDITDTLQLKNIVGYVRDHEDYINNTAGLNGGVVYICGSSCRSGGIPEVNTEQLSEEVRLSGHAIQNRLTWAGGLYVDEQRPDGLNELSSETLGILNRDGVDQVTTKSHAIYGSGEFDITDKFKWNAGLRFTHDSVDSEQNNFISPLNGGQAALQNFLTTVEGLPAPIAGEVVAATFAPLPHGRCVTYGAGGVINGPTGSPCLRYDATFNAPTGTTGLSYQIGQNQLLYAKISRGYRPGGVNGTAPPGVDPSYNPEYDVSTEIGIKSDFHFDDMFLRTNVAVYNDHYTAIQKTVTLPGSVPVSVIRNVDGATIRGLETEITFVPFKGLSLSSNFAYTDPRFNTLQTPAAGNPCDPTQPTTVGFCSANRFSGVPKIQITGRADYTLPLPQNLGPISIGGQIFHQSSESLAPDSALNPQAIEPGYTTLDFNATWHGAFNTPVDVTGFVTNATDVTYRTGAIALLESASIGIAGNIYAPPRMYGVSLKYRFGGDAMR